MVLAVSVVVMAYNEAPSLGAVVQEIVLELDSLIQSDKELNSDGYCNIR